MKKFILALTFLTVLPAPPKFISEGVLLSQCMVYFPLVGCFIGGIQYLLATFGPRQTEINAFLLILSSVILTRGLHLDGLADTIDGFFGALDKEGRLRIMKDPHLGAFGAIGIFLLLLGKFLLYEQVIKRNLLLLLMAAPVLSRWGMVFLAFISQPARPEGMGKTFAQNLSKKTFIYASIWAAFLIFFIAQNKGLFLWGLTTAFLWLFRHFSYKKIQGITGDVLGASGELMEVIVLTAGLLSYLFYNV